MCFYLLKRLKSPNLNSTHTVQSTTQTADRSPVAVNVTQRSSVIGQRVTFKLLPHRHRHSAESAGNHPTASFRANCQTKVSKIGPLFCFIINSPSVGTYNISSVICLRFVFSTGSGSPKMSSYKERFQTLLHEKNFVTDQLATLEEKTGVKREYTALGMLKARWIENIS